jgi:hypothetical protein
LCRVAETATREQQTHADHLEALLAAEMEERGSRAIARLLNEARLPRMKTLEAFEVDRSGVSADQMRELAGGEAPQKGSTETMARAQGKTFPWIASGKLRIIPHFRCAIILD